MGVADLGLRNVSGNLTPYVLNSSSVAGTADITDAQAAYLDGESPDSFAIQFNAVATNVTLFGQSGYEFWTQDFATYTPSTRGLAFGDNVWNFSAPSLALPASTIYSHGRNGTLVAPTVYFATGPTVLVSYPFSVAFYLNATTVGGRSAIYVNYSISGPSVRTAGSTDLVVFQSAVGGGTPDASVPQFQVNGTGVDPAFYENDVELVLVGDGGLDTTTFFAINATLAIRFWDATAASYASFPSAFNAGADTGETSDGLDVTYTAVGGAPEAVVALGPSFVDGLWNVSSDPGHRTISEVLHPTNAFIFVNPGRAFNESAAQWVPTMAVGAGTNLTFSIPNDGSVFLEALLSDYTRATQAIDPIANGSATRVVTLVRSVANGVYTPLIAWGNGQLAALAPTTGNGTASAPYTLYNNELGPLPSLFAATNEFLFPVFPGLLLIDTTAYVNVTLPSFAIDYPAPVDAALASLGLPLHNDLQAEFWQVSHVVLKDSPSISGWLPFTLAGRPAGAVMFWNSSDNLVADDRFDDQGVGLVLGGDGTNNTVWGDTFLRSTAPGTNASALQQAPNNITGVVEAESTDLVFNNYFDVPDPAFTPTVAPGSCDVSCRPLSALDSWNISLARSSASREVLGLNLTGSIIGTWYQGGNYWSNYGSPPNPFGGLPYNNSGRVAHGGDFLPLEPFSLYPVTFAEAGAPAGLTWAITALNVTTTTTTTNLTVFLPNGTTAYTIAPPAGYTGPPGGNVTVSGVNQTVDLVLHRLLLVQFVETGLVNGSDWNVSLESSSPPGVPETENSFDADTVNFSVPAGAYSYVVAAFGYAPTPSSGSFTLATAGTTVRIGFAIAPVAAFSESGLPSNASWTVSIVDGTDHLRFAAEGSSVNLSAFDIPPGSYTWAVAAPGYSAIPSAGSASTATPFATKIVFSVVDGILSGTVRPDGAAVTLNGTPIPVVAGAFTVSEPAGVYSVVVTSPGYAAYSTDVEVASNSTTPIAIVLTPLPAAGGPFGISVLGWGLIVGLALVAVGAVMLGWGRRRRSIPLAARPAPRLAASSLPPRPTGAPPSTRAPWEEGPADAGADPTIPQAPE